MKKIIATLVFASLSIGNVMADIYVGNVAGVRSCIVSGRGSKPCSAEGVSCDMSGHCTISGIGTGKVVGGKINADVKAAPSKINLPLAPAGVKVQIQNSTR